MRQRTAFTLVELMVVISIIALIASFLLAGLWLAQNSARDAKTKTIIAKIDTQLALRWESYETRPVPVDATALAKSVFSISGNPSPQQRAAAVLIAKREMQRMEMPDRFSDIIDPPVVLPTNQRPALSQRYLAWYQSFNSGSGPSPENQSAECLYLILTTSAPGAPSARHVFRAGETDDTDKDGAEEIVDAWGQPIRYIRWPTGATLAYDIDKSSGERTEATGPDVDAAAISDLQSVDDQDMLDPMQSHKLRYSGQESWSLFPLVYSTGPSGAGPLDHGLGPGPPLAYSGVENNPFDTSARGIGAPSTTKVGSSYQFLHYDNIHNHMLQAQ